MSLRDWLGPRKVPQVPVDAERVRVAHKQALRSRCEVQRDWLVARWAKELNISKEPTK